MRRHHSLIATVVAALAVTSCATTMTVSSHVERGLDFSPYRTFAWGPADALPTGDPRLDHNPFFKDYLQGAVERRLAERGIELSMSGTPDLLLHYHANARQRFDVNRVEVGYEDCLTNPCISITDYEAGTIVLDMIDTSTDRLVWRGWAQEDLEALIGNQSRMRKTIDQAITKMLQTLPTT